jgi:hypothetical protein
MSMKNWWDDANRGKSNVLGEILFQYHFVHYKSETCCPAIETFIRGWKPARNTLSQKLVLIERH